MKNKKLSLGQLIAHKQVERLKNEYSQKGENPDPARELKTKITLLMDPLDNEDEDDPDESWAIQLLNEKE